MADAVQDVDSGWPNVLDGVQITAREGAILKAKMPCSGKALQSIYPK